MSISRREFLRIVGGSGVALVVTACAPKATRLEDDVMGGATTRLNPVPTSTLSQHSVPTPAAFEPDVDITLRAVLAKAQIQAGPTTNVAQYVGELHKGDSRIMRTVPDSFLGPTLHLHKGQKVRVTLRNELPRETIIHWHGQHLPEEMDGHPRYVVQSQESYVYEFVVNNRAGTYWYHPHPHQQTGGQVYFGLAGFLIIHDEEEAQFALPQGEFDVPMVIQDRTLDAENQFQYLNNMHQVMAGYFGNTLLVNGRMNYIHEVTTRAYRIRLLNGSNARTYKLAWDDGAPMTVIGTDGGLLERPVQRNFVMLGSAERLDLWVDFSQSAVASERKLIALPFTGGNEVPVDIMQFNITHTTNENDILPQQFAPLAFNKAEDARNFNNPRTFNFYVNHMTPTVDGMSFDMNDATDHETVRLNDLEVWELTNDVNGTAGFPHPIHVHGLQFQVIERTGTPVDIIDGYVDEGWKDTILLMPNERAKILLKFEDYSGLFLYHCHNLEHEDGGMMRNYRIVS
jgi:FtsP/CotA-like multicopper oxidase with cupredoxin domain